MGKVAVTSDGTKGGYLAGKRHKDGGIKAVVTDGNTPVELEKDEVIITRKAVFDDTLHDFNGQKLTNKQILSKINVSGGGVAFADGGVIPDEIHTTPRTYMYGGKMLRGNEIVHQCGCKHKMAAGGRLGEGDPREGQSLHAGDIPASVKAFMPQMQIRAIVGSAEHWEVIDRLERVIREMPETYETENIPENDKIVYLHYFFGNSDWYIVEKDKGNGPSDMRQDQAFGFVILNGDYDSGEWGYISIEELKDTNKVELDFYFTPTRFFNLFYDVEETTEEQTQAIIEEAVETVITPKVEETGLIAEYANKSQYEINNAIRKLIHEKGTDATLYSADEKAFLRLYEGSGGLSAKGETGARLLDQFFTPVDICGKMWGLALKYGFNFENTAICEPAFGSGRFLSFVPADANCYVSGYEIDETAYGIGKVLYPKFDLKLASFETQFFVGRRHIGLSGVSTFFDLVIGNPPYRPYISEYSPLGEKDATGAETFEMYFIMRGVDVLKKDGLLIMIIPNTFLSNKNKYNDFKNTLNKKAALLDAYRLPNDVFPNTGVGTDIIVLKKR